MGREVKRVPLDFLFPLDASYADAAYDRHCATCPNTGEDAHDECAYERRPPNGDGWQLWQTVSDGPVTPVFATADALIDWMCQPVPESEQPRYNPGPYPDMPSGKGWRREIAEPFVKEHGSAPSFVTTGGRLIGGPEFVVEMGKAKAST